VKNLALGLMSGTSADGVSVAAVRLRPFKVVAHKTYPYKRQLRRQILSSPGFNAKKLSELNFTLGKVFAETAARFCREHKISADSLSCIGSHGQTVLHSPLDKLPHTLQIGEASFIAEELGVPTISDFRPRDMAAGGQGAPLVPFFDDYLFGRGKPVLLQNIGGIANIAAAGHGVRACGFDTGPGNCLMDLAVSLGTSGRLGYDKNGALAARGKADTAKVMKLLRLPYFAKKPPKSLDRNQFGELFLRKHFGKINKANLPQVLATLNLFTAATIAYAARRFALPRCRAGKLLVSGGGALNPVLMRNLRRQLPELQVLSSSEAGLPELAKEAACFALLAWLALQGKSNNCPRATGAYGKRILGKISL